MKLAELLEQQFRGDIRFRGAAYLEADRVAVTRVTPERVQACVRDGVEHHTQLVRDEDKVRMHCTCDPFSRSGVCKHLWGTILATDAGGFVNDGVRLGHVPPFLAEAEPAESLIDLDDDWDLDDMPVRVGGRRPTSRKVEVRLRPWETRLNDLRQRLDIGTHDPSKQSREREILYQVDVEHSRKVRQLVIQTSQRQRRASGQWGKLKPLKLRPEQLQEVENADDRQILAYLSGAVAERSNWQAQQVETRAAAWRYQVPFELSTLILPALSETGRLVYLDAEQHGASPLTLGDDAPWELTISVRPNDGDADWSLHGLLRRDDDTLKFDDVELVLPGGFVFGKDRIDPLRDFDAFEWTQLLDGEHAVTVPDDDRQEFVDRLLDMPALPRLDLPADLQLEEVECRPAPHLVIHTPRRPRWQSDRLRTDVLFDYMGTMLSGSSQRWAIVQREHNRCISRDREFEEEKWAQLRDQGLRRVMDRRRGDHDAEIDARHLGSAVRSLMDLGWTVQAEGRQVRQAGDTRFRVHSDVDWFELHAEIDFDGRSVAFPELLAALSRGDSTVRLDDGSLGILPEDWLRQFGLIAGLGEADENAIRFGNDQAALLDAILGTLPEVDYDDRFIELRDRFQSISGVEAAKEPEKFEGELRAYQRDGLGWLLFLREFRFGGCLADDMGLGKTVQILALLQQHYHSAPRRGSKDRNPSLVVVPRSLLFNWYQECQRFTPELKVLEYTGLERAPLRDRFKEFDILLTTYGTMRRDAVSLKDHNFEYVILDEAQTIKNPSSQVARASRLLQSNHRVALSGTPIENHLGDLWSIFEFLNPGMLGRSTAFRIYASDAENVQSRQLLAQGLRPFILRRTKQEVESDLPQKQEETIFCDLGEEQRRLYDELRVHYRDSLLGLVKEQGLAKTRMHVLEALLRLRQAACHPALLNRGEQVDGCAKLDFLCPHLEELLQEGHKALVFSQFTSMLAIVKQHLDTAGVTYEYLDGQTRDRQARVERFQNDEACGVFLISLKAGGLGLNLTAADYVFLLDPWWNPAVEAQAIDRAHRVGQTRPVFAYRMICRDTVEEKIAELQGRKRELADAILEADSGSTLKDLSLEDLERLLS